MQTRYDGLNAFFGVAFEDDLGLAFKRGKLDGTEDWKTQFEWAGAAWLKFGRLHATFTYTHNFFPIIHNLPHYSCSIKKCDSRFFFF